LEVLSRNLLGGTEKNHGKQSEETVFGPRYDLRPTEYKKEIQSNPQQHSVILKRFRFVSDFSSVFGHIVYLTGSQMYMTRLHIKRSRNQGSISYKIKSFTFFTASRLALEPILPPIQCASELLFPRVKQPGRETDHSFPSSAEVKNIWTYTFTPYTSLWLKHRNKFSTYRYLQKIPIPVSLLVSERICVNFTIYNFT
jgi:hypothetical protein